MRWSRQASRSPLAAMRRRVLNALEGLHGAKGRLELVGHRNGAPIFVDYAHKPDALAKALDALRPYVKRELVVVFGAGGDRDKGKRPLMGAIAAAEGRRIVVTDDNPRTEERRRDPQAILAAAPGATEIGDRREAIRRAVAELQAGRRAADRGQGPREQARSSATKVLPFSDHEAVADALQGARRMSDAVVDDRGHGAAMRAATRRLAA